MNFIKPIKYGKLIDESPKKYTYESDTSDTIIAPYNGVIYDTDTGKCEGFVQIAHLVDKKVIYSEICGINRNIYVSNNLEVKQGDIIGHCGGNKVTFEIKDSNKRNIKIEPFFADTFEKNTEPEKDKGLEKDKEPKKEKEGLKKEPEKEPKKEDPNKNVDGDKDKKKWDFNRKLEDVPDLFGSLLLTPLDIVNKAFTPKKKKETSEEELKEEIKRMKQLIK